MRFSFSFTPSSSYSDTVNRPQGLHYSTFYCCWHELMLLTNVTSHEGDHQLLAFAALAAGFRNSVLVEQLNSALKAGKLHHGVGNLSHPQRNHTLIETTQRTGHNTSQWHHQLTLIQKNTYRLKHACPFYQPALLFSINTYVTKSVDTLLSLHFTVFSQCLTLPALQIALTQQGYDYILLL